MVFLAFYNKGANAERELIKVLDGRGFAVLRVAGSGVNPIPSPDVVALKGGKIFAVECKARKGDYLAIPIKNMVDEINWSRVAGAEFFVGWKVPHKGWFFLKPEQFRITDKNYMVSLEEVLRVGKKLEEIFV